jgi:hypothetical protein
MFMTVTRALAGLNSAVRRLEKAADNHAKKAAKHSVIANLHIDEAHAHHANSERAIKVVANIKALIEG